MLGIEDKYIALAYVLSILGAVLCVVYGLINWNRGDEAVESADIHWAAKQNKAEQEQDL
jgi:hypothetical protein